MKLTAADRRAVVENLLDIDVFSIMNTLVRARFQMVKEYIKDIDYKIEIAKSKIDEKQKLIKTLEKKSSDSVEKHKTEINESEKQIKEFQEDIEIYQNDIDKLLEQTKDRVAISNNILKSESLETQLKNEIKTIYKNIKFYEENDTCPSCKQNIEQHHKECVYKEKEDERNEIIESLEMLVDNIEVAENKLSAINKTLENIHKIEKQVYNKQNQISVSSQYISKMKKNIESILNEGTEVQETKDELNKLIGEGTKHS